MDVRGKQVDTWSDDYFYTNLAPQNCIPLFSFNQVKASFLRLIGFYANGLKLPADICKDIYLVVLATLGPSPNFDPMFQFMMDENGTYEFGGETQSILIPFVVFVVRKGYRLKDASEENKVSVNRTMQAIIDFWVEADWTIRVASDTDKNSLGKARLYMAAVSYITLNMFKLLPKERFSVKFSPNLGMTEAFNELYRPAKPIFLPYPHRSAMQKLNSRMTAADPIIAKTFACIITAWVHYSHLAESNEAYLGVLRSSCLLDSSMSGLDLPKLYEMMRFITGESNKMLIPYLWTNETMRSCLELYEHMETTAKGMGENKPRLAYVTGGPWLRQLTWKWSRVFSTSHYMTLTGRSNLPLCARLAVIIDQSQGRSFLKRILLFEGEIGSRAYNSEQNFAKEFLIRFGRNIRSLGVIRSDI